MADTDIARWNEERDSAAFGRQLRLLRNARGLSLKEISALADISVGMLSQIERGVSSPSLRSMHRLAVALEVPLAWFFEHSSPVRSDEEDTIVRRSGRKLLRLVPEQILKERLTPEGLGEVVLMLITIEPGGSSGHEQYSHYGQDAGFVLKGRLLLTVNGKVHTLSEGDSFGFPSTLPHRFENGGSKQAQVIWLNTVRPEREDDHDAPA